MSRQEPALERRRVAELIAASDASRQTGSHVLGVGQAREAAALAERYDWPAQRARAMLLQGTHEFRLGGKEACIVTLREAADLYDELGDLRGVSSALNMSVIAHVDLGMFEEALELAELNLEIAKRSGDELALAWAYNRAGTAYAGVGNEDSADRSMEFAQRLARESRDEELLFSVLNNRVEDLAMRGRRALDAGREREATAILAMAGEFAAEAEDLARRSANAHRQAISLLNRGRVSSALGHYEEALRLLDEAEELAGANRFRPLLFSARQARAAIALERGQTRAAIAAFRELLPQAEQANSGSAEPELLLALSQAHERLGEYREALDCFRDYHDLDRQQGSRAAEIHARLLFNRLELDRAQWDAERAALQAELERARLRELEAQHAALEQETALLARHAHEDELTGLSNRRRIEAELPRLLSEMASHDGVVSVAIIDTDSFKSVNDRHGHLVGDEVLRQIAAIIKAHTRPTDVVARLGGDEFIALLPGAGSDAAAALGHRLCDAVRERDWSKLGLERAPTVSVGIATAGAAGPLTDIEHAARDLIERGDQALYAAKRAGRDCAMVAAPPAS